MSLDGYSDRIHPSAYFDSVGCVADTSAVVARDVALAVAVADTFVVVAVAYTTAHAAAAVDNLAEEVQLVQH